MNVTDGLARQAVVIIPALCVAVSVQLRGVYETLTKAISGLMDASEELKATAQGVALRDATWEKLQQLRRLLKWIVRSFYVVGGWIFIALLEEFQLLAWLAGSRQFVESSGQISPAATTIAIIMIGLLFVLALPVIYINVSISNRHVREAWPVLEREHLRRRQKGGA
nr:hypothetical protein OG296_30265 [Streptomyces sp. NBC_01001]